MNFAAGPHDSANADPLEEYRLGVRRNEFSQSHAYLG